MIAIDWILGILLLASSFGVILTKKPVRASLSFLATLILLASIYLRLSAEFIAVLQVLAYAGAILVIFMFVIILFQDAHEKISEISGKTSKKFLAIVIACFFLALLFLTFNIKDITSSQELPKDFGSAHSLGMIMYRDFFFPFEAVVLLFLIAIVGAVYIARKDS